jgi:hypothetical protein
MAFIPYTEATETSPTYINSHSPLQRYAPQYRVLLTPAVVYPLGSQGC